MENAIVINKKGDFVAFVAVSPETKLPQFYEMQDGDTLIFDDIITAMQMLKPRWDDLAWQETATKKALAARKAAKQPDRKTLERQIRAKRNAILAETDPTQFRSRDTAGRFTLEYVEAMATYRQALRDLPQQKGFPEDVVWPERPLYQLLTTKEED